MNITQLMKRLDEVEAQRAKQTARMRSVTEVEKLARINSMIAAAEAGDPDPRCQAVARLFATARQRRDFSNIA